MESGFLEIGRVGKPSGLKGHFKIISFASSWERFSPGTTVYLARGEELKAYLISEAKPQGKAVIIRLAGLENRQAVEDRGGTAIYIKKEELRDLPANEFYWSELIGSRVFDDQGRLMGTVKEIFTTPAHDIWVIGDREKEVLIPALEEFVASVNTVQKEICLKPLNGLDQVNDL